MVRSGVIHANSDRLKMLARASGGNPLYGSSKIDSRFQSSMTSSSSLKNTPEAKDIAMGTVPPISPNVRTCTTSAVLENSRYVATSDEGRVDRLRSESAMMATMTAVHEAAAPDGVEHQVLWSGKHAHRITRQSCAKKSKL